MLDKALAHNHEWSRSEVEFYDGIRQITVLTCKRCGICSRVIDDDGRFECINDRDCDTTLIEAVMEK